nr:hypothetical protein [Roseomonas gilardii]
MTEGQGNAQSRGELQAEVKTGHHAGGNVNGQGEPGTVQRTTVDGGHHHDVGQGVIDLHQSEWLLLGEMAGNPAELAACVPGTPATAEQLTRIQGCHTLCNSLARRQCKILGNATASNLTHQVSQRRAIGAKVELVDGLLDGGFHGLVEQADAGAASAWAWEQRRDSSVRAQTA